jgi:hypothetical protein
MGGVNKKTFKALLEQSYLIALKSLFIQPLSSVRSVSRTYSIPRVAVGRARNTIHNWVLEAQHLTACPWQRWNSVMWAFRTLLWIDLRNTFLLVRLKMPQFMFNFLVRADSYPIGSPRVGATRVAVVSRNLYPERKWVVNKFSGKPWKKSYHRGPARVVSGSEQVPIRLIRATEAGKKFNPLNFLVDGF